MNEQWRMHLTQTAERTFEQLCFMFPDPDAADEAAAGEGGIAVRVKFRGLLSGELVIHLSGGVMTAVALNMLGEDEPPSLEKQCDAVGEMANIICGNVLPRIANTRSEFLLEAPARLDDAWKPNDTSETDLIEVHLAFDEGPARLYLLVDEAEPFLRETNGSV